MTNMGLSRLGLLFLIGGVSVMNAGCWEVALIAALASDHDDTATDPGYDPYDDPYYSDPSYDAGTFDDGAVDVTATSLGGALGEHRFDGGIWMQSGYDYGGYASIEVDARDRDEGWSVMALLDVEGGLQHPDLVPGAVLTFRDADYYSGDTSSRVFVSLLGCAGPVDGGFDFDRRADEVTIEVLEGSTRDARVLHYTGTWSDGSTLDGTVEVR